MRIFISGICGFVGSSLALGWKMAGAGHQIFGCDSFIRPGSETNRLRLKEAGIPVLHMDIRSASDFESLPAADYVVDAAANPSVLAGVDGKSSSRQVIEHNLGGTINLLEYCKRVRAGFVLLSTSRVYSILPLTQLPVEVDGRGAFRLRTDVPLPPGVSPAGINESFSTTPPLSLYGATKVASETLALEYGETFGFPVWINRCGVLAGAHQFGHAEQGIFSFWIHSWCQRQPLRYIGFEGTGHQVRDLLHPRDLLSLLDKQFVTEAAPLGRVFNVAGGPENSLSLRQLSDWCTERFGPREVAADAVTRRFDVPWVCLDSTRVREAWQWQAQTGWPEVLEEIAQHAESHPSWLASCLADRAPS